MRQNLKERVKSKKGITLIALVITIIVLLILAGVTIATLTGDNGILTKAQSAKKVSTDAEIEEKIKLAVIASKINESNTVDTDVLTTELNNQFGDDGWEKTEIDENTWKITVNGKSYKIDLTTGAIEKVTGIIVSANPSKVLAGKTATITATLEGIDKTGDISFTVSGALATISNVNQTENGATAKVTIAEDATGNIEIEGKMDEGHKSKCTIKVIQDVTNVAVDSNLAKVETGGTLDIASCITNEENIEEFTITNVTGNATKENDKTIKGTGTVDGTATVTITGEETGKTKDITITVKKVEVLGVGAYVNYSVDYENVATTGSGTCIPKDEFAGKWRILDLGANNSDGTYGTEENPVRIVSAGVPLTYYHVSPNSTSVTNLTTGFFSTPINTETKTSYNYYRCGFKNGSTALTNINDVKNLFNNNITAKNGETPKVQAMTKEDFDKVYDPTGETTTTANTYVNDAKFDNMLAIPCKDQSVYSFYYLASAYLSNHLWGVNSNGNTYYFYYVPYGVRPVVTLVPNISITKGTNGAWNLSSNNN